MSVMVYYILIVNLVAFCMMYLDKQKAIRRKWRIPEAHLFAAAFILGSLGILSGMILFHHKTRHIKFVLGVPVLFIVQAYILLKLMYI